MNLLDGLQQQQDDLTRISTTLAWLLHLATDTSEKRLFGLHNAYTELDKTFGRAVDVFAQLALDAGPQSAFATVLGEKTRGPPPIPIEKYMGTSRLDAPY
jgi:hypothetical protein